MGNQQACIRPKEVKYPQNMFKVRNVDEKGTEIRRAVIEVTKTDIILHQRGKEFIRWPLRSLRRYGFDKKLFSFESGRRCTTGPGIYAFKCKRAEFLFRSVQENAHACGENNRYGNYSPDGSTNGTPTNASPNNRSVNSSTASMYGLTGFSGRSLSSSMSDVVAQNPPAPQPSSLHYINANSFAGIPESPHEDEADSSVITTSLLSQVSEEVSPSSSEDEDPNINYARLKHDMDEETCHEFDASSSLKSDVNGNLDSCRLKTLAISDVPDAVSAIESTATSLPEPYYMKPTSVQDIINGNTIPLRATLNMNCNVAATSLKTNNGPVLEIGAENIESGSMTSLSYPGGVRSPASVTTPNGRMSGTNSYYANLDTVGELPHNFIFSRDPRSPPCSTSSKGSGGSEFMFDSMGSRSPVSEHSYANLDALSEVGVRPPTFGRSSNVVLQPAPKGRMNYADLDMESLEAAAQLQPAVVAVAVQNQQGTGTLASPPQTGPSVLAEGSSRFTDTYTRIDFNRTTALANSQRQIDDVSITSARRTRHDNKMR